MSFIDRDQPAWRHYRNDRMALQGILEGHRREMARAREFIDWANQECVDIDNHLHGRGE